MRRTPGSGGLAVTGRLSAIGGQLSAVSLGVAWFRDVKKIIWWFEIVVLEMLIADN
jgi:hypothetical protein